MKIIADQQIPFARQLFSRLGDVVLLDGRSITPGQLEDADVLLVRSVTRVNRGLLEKSPVRFVGTATSGFDHVDTPFLQKNHIGFGYAPGSNARSVAEYVLSSLFVVAGQRDFSLQGRSIAIIGCGHVGSAVQGFAQALGMRCYLNDPPLRENSGNAVYCDLDEALVADIVTLHVPLTETGAWPTRGMVNADFLSRLKPDGILINTSRGEVVDETDFSHFININRGFSAVLDVWSGEPDIDTGLLSRVAIGTPHIAGYSLDGKVKATRMLYRQACECLGVLAGPEPELEIPDPELNEICLDAGEDDIQYAVLAGYDVRSDAATLRRIKEIPVDARGDYFDALRNNYPVRREFTHIRVRLPSAQGLMRGRLEKLGFTVNK